MNQKQLTLTELQPPITTEKKVTLNPETFIAKVKIGFSMKIYRKIFFS
jgi:hypothetical protein